MKEFFRNLSEELERIVPVKLRKLVDLSPEQRVLEDWRELARRFLSPECKALESEFDLLIRQIASRAILSQSDDVSPLPEDAPSEFAKLSADFTAQLDLSRRAIELLRWSEGSLSQICAALSAVMTAPQTRSLLSALAIGKDAAQRIGPLTAVVKELRLAYKKREEIAQKEDDLATLEELSGSLDEIKLLKKYAENEIRRIFDDIRDDTLSNWNTLYPETPSVLSPARLLVGTGKDKSVTALLSNGASEVPAQFFGNAGLQRAIALSFYFALLEKHPNGLGFVVLDDPVLSLDDGHRESWSRHILKMWMDRKQFIVATHQLNYLTNCRRHFSSGRVVELNPRLRATKISWRPGNRLDRAQQELARAPTNAPNEMRKYREELLHTLDAYCVIPFFDPGNLKQTLADYANFRVPHPLASNAQNKITKILGDDAITTVLDPGSHHLSEGDVTPEMSRDCLAALKRCDGTLQSEIERLERVRRHNLRHAAVSSSLIPFIALSEEATWRTPIILTEFGRAAAKAMSWVVDDPGEPGVARLSAGSAVLVASDAFAPIAQPGQWVLLETEEMPYSDGDLVAVTCSNGDYLLRRIWSAGDEWLLQAINPVNPVPSVATLKTESAARKVIGVLFEPHRAIVASTRKSVREWCPRADFSIDWLSKLATVAVEGASLEPIARPGQRVLIDKEPAVNARAVNNGELAVIDTQVDRVGCVIKRVFHLGDNCVLTSPNPVDPHPPEVLSKTELEKSRFWVVRGVLFESAESS